MKPILVVAGEASGDLHGAEILKALRSLEPSVRLIGVGGSLMTPFLDRKLADISDLSVMGLIEVVKHLPKLMHLFNKILKAALEENVGGVLLIDYPGFNIRLAKALRKIIPGVRLHQFVCPQVWAWKAGRIPTLGNTLDTIYCLFDFEPKLFEGYQVEAVHMGNPIIETVAAEVDREAFFVHSGLNPALPVVSLLPGSRIEEVNQLMPQFVKLVESWQSSSERCAVQWVIPVAPTLNIRDFHSYTKGNNITLVHGLSYASRAYATAALVCSGTATLETAILGTPFATLYKLNGLTYLIAKQMVKIKHFSLTNIVAGYQVVPELLQGEINVQRLSTELVTLLKPEVAARMRVELGKVRARLGESGAAKRVASHMLKAMIL